MHSPLLVLFSFIRLQRYPRRRRLWNYRDALQSIHELVLFVNVLILRTDPVRVSTFVCKHAVLLTHQSLLPPSQLCNAGRSAKLVDNRIDCIAWEPNSKIGVILITLAGQSYHFWVSGMRAYSIRSILSRKALLILRVCLSLALTTGIVVIRYERIKSKTPSWLFIR
jgi:hypothetical protein